LALGLVDARLAGHIVGAEAALDRDAGEVNGFAAICTPSVRM
jgi:hypothetical protein